MHLKLGKRHKRHNPSVLFEKFQSYTYWKIIQLQITDNSFFYFRNFMQVSQFSERSSWFTYCQSHILSFINQFMFCLARARSVVSQYLTQNMQYWRELTFDLEMIHVLKMLNLSVFLSKLNCLTCTFIFLQQDICLFSDTTDVQRPKATRSFYAVIWEKCYNVVFLNLDNII